MEEIAERLQAWLVENFSSGGCSWQVEEFGRCYNTTGIRVTCTSEGVSKTVSFDASTIATLAGIGSDVVDYFDDYYDEEKERMMTFNDLPDEAFYH